MAKDVIIVPGSGEVTFYENGSAIGRMYQSGNNIYLNPVGEVVLGDGTTAANIELGTLSTSVDLNFLGGGNITANGSVLSIGQSGDIVNLNVSGVTYNLPSNITAQSLQGYVPSSFALASHTHDYTNVTGLTTYVTTQINNLIAGAPGALNTLDELAAALGDDANFASNITNSISTKAPLASPALTGTPTAPTAATATNNTQIATTAFVKAQGYITGYTETDTLSSVTGRGASTGTSVTLTGNNIIPKIFIERSNYGASGISWYSSGFSSWATYMGPAGTSGQGPTGNITPPSGSYVTTWGLRNFIENASGYGWTWESGSATGQPSIVAELSSATGNFRTTGTISASNFSGSSSGTNTGDQTTVSGNAGSATVLQTARTLTIGNTGKTFNGSANVSWSLAEIGAQPAGSYLTSYTETDTLASVTGRGATTSSKVFFTYNTNSEPLSAVEINGGGTHTGLYINPAANSQAHIRFGTNGTLKWQIRAPFHADGVDTSLKFYSWVSGADKFIFNHDGSATFNGGTVWTSTNDGSGSSLDADLLDGIQASSFLRSDVNSTFTGALTINGDIRGTGQQLVLNAGESYAYASGQTDEYVYVNAEQGFMVSTSPDNWGSGWAGRQTTIITGTSISVNGSTVWHTGNFNPGSYLGISAKAADSNLFDGIDSVNFVYGNAKGTNDSVTTNNDDLDKTGYYTSGGFATRPSGVANWMYIEHIKLYNSNTAYQKQIGYDTYDNRMWSRTKNNGTWTNWAQIWTSDVFSNNSTNWNTAYGWGNHASAGYLTSYTETDTLDSVVARGNTTARGITLGNGAPWTPLVINASAGEGTANAGVAIALDGESYAEYGYRFKANGANYYQVLYDGSSINWKHYNSGYQTKMSLSNAGNLTLTGTLTASGYNKTNWDTAYGWGNHTGLYLPLSGGTVTGSIVNSGSSTSFRNRIGIGDGNGVPYTNTGSPGIWLSYNGASTQFMGAESTTSWGVYINSNWRMTVSSGGVVTATSFTGSLSGNATTATTLATARTLTIGNTGKTFNGSANVSWSLAEIGAQPAGSYLTSEADTLATVTARGGVTSSRIYADNGVHVRGDWVRVDGSNGIYFESHGGGWRMTDGTWIRAYNDKNIYTGGDMQASRFYDANDSNYYIDSAGTSHMNDLRVNIIYDRNNTSYYVDPASTTVLNTTYINNGYITNVRGDYYFQQSHGTPRNNLGDPTVTEMALFNEQFNNKTAFLDPSRVTVWKQQNDGDVWEDITGNYGESAIRRFIAGYDSSSNIFIPNGVFKFRIEVTHPNYVFANAVYFYWSSNSHSTKLHLWARRTDNNVWYQRTSADNGVSSWPGHLYMPFSSVAWHPTANSSGHYNALRFEFIPSWQTSNPTYANTNIDLYKMQVWGGYPAGTRFPYTVNEFGDFTSVRNLSANGIVYASGGNSNNWNTAYNWGDHSSQGYITSSASITGNAATATKLATARSIALSGDVTGSANFDGSGNITISATVADNSHSHTNYAPLASPALTGTPTAPTASAATNTTQIATTAFVKTAISDLVSSAPTTLDTLNELATALGNDANFSATITTALGGKLGNSGQQQLQKTAHAPGTSSYHLELYSPDTGDSNNEISMRFHQGNRYWGQLRYRNGAFRITGGADDTVATMYANIVGNVTGNATTATTLANARTLTIGSTGKAFDGSANVSWTLAEIGAQPAGSYLTSVPAATSTARGGVELFSDTVQTVAANAVTATASRTYGVQLNSAGQAVVNVPWVDTNTVYTLPVAGTSIGGVKSGTDITVDASGNVSVNDDSHNHTIANVDGLQTALDGKAASSHTHPYLPLTGGTLTGGLTTPSVNITTNNGVATLANDDTLSGWAYNGKKLVVSGQETAPSGVFFSPDGTNMYVCGTSGDDINRYTLSTAWDISTASYNSVSGNVGDSSPQDLYISPDGRNIYIVGASGDSVRQFSNSSAWVITGLTFVRSFSVAAQDTTPTGLDFKDDGTIMYISGDANNKIYQYNLGTAWDISTAVYNQELSISAYASTPNSVEVSADGTKLYTVGSSGDEINRFDLSTPYNISTAVFYNNLYVGFNLSSPTGLYVNLTQDRIYIVGSSSDSVFQYNAASNSLYLDTQNLFINGGSYTNGNVISTGSVRIDGTLSVASTTYLGTVSAGTTTVSTFTAGSTTSSVNLGTGHTTGTVTIGGTAGTGIITIGRSTSTQAINIGGSGNTITFGTTPIAPTPATATNDTTVATTAFVKAQGYLTSIAANSIGAGELNVSGNGTTAQYLRSDGDGSFTWATPPDTNTTYSAGTGLSLSGTTFSLGSHSHSISDISNLQATLNTKATFTDDVYLNDSATTASFLAELYNEFNAFRDNYVILKMAWSYSGNSDLDTGTHGIIELAGCIVEAFGDSNSKHVRITRPTTGAGASVDMLVYNEQYTGYSPGWTRIYNDRNLSLATLGYTGATNANYITNNNQLTNGAGYITGSGSTSGNAGTATKLATARTLTIGSTGKTFDGSVNVSWTLAEIGAQAAGSYAAASHTHAAGDITSGTFAAARIPDLSGTYLGVSATAADSSKLGGIAAASYSQTSHNHTYDVNNAWLRDNGDNANVKLYGNTRQMAFRTDGTTEYASGVGGYAFAWMYGGDASTNRRMLLASDGRLWTNYHGWLDSAFQAAASAINTGNIGSQSVNYANSSNVANKLQSSVGTWGGATNFNNFREVGKTIVRDILGADRPTSTAYPGTPAQQAAGTGGYNYGTLLSCSGDYAHFEIYVPNNTGNIVHPEFVPYLRTGYTGGWSDWSRFVMSTGDTTTLVGGDGVQLVVDSQVGWNTPASTSIVLDCQADNWASSKYRFMSKTSNSTGADFTIDKYTNDGGWRNLGFINKNGDDNLYWMMDVVQGFSDSRLKTNVANIEGAIDKVKQMRGVTFDWDPDMQEAHRKEGSDIGFIAQELEEIAPELVVERPDGYKSVKYEKAVPILLEAIKEQQSLIEQLIARVEALENL